MKTGQPTSALSFRNPAVRRRLRKLALIAGVLLVFCYVAGLAAGYLWLRHGRGIEKVRLRDIALLRVDAVRQTLGQQHFVRARGEAAAKNYQAAYISFASGLRQAPNDIPGRLDAAAFFREVGAANQSLAILEEGLARHRDNPELIRATFDFLLESGRGRYALEQLEKIHGPAPRGEQARLLLTYRLRATLAAEGPAAAGLVLQQHPELKEYAPAVPVVARLLWESSDKTAAIDLMARHLDTSQASYDDHASLVSWQQGAGRKEDAIRTAQRVCEKFPDHLGARVQLIEAKAGASPVGAPPSEDVLSYLRDHSHRPEALVLLAAAAGRQGWDILARLLYEHGTVSQPQLAYLALSYADSLARNLRFGEFHAVLAQLEGQAADSPDHAFLLQLRLRQVIAAGAMREPDNVREYTRRLAALVRSEPDRLEGFRRFFHRAGLTDAVEELTPKPVPVRPATSKAKADAGT